MKIAVFAIMAIQMLQSCSAPNSLQKQEETLPARKVWTKAQANDWYAKQGCLVGADFLPSTAINRLKRF